MAGKKGAQKSKTKGKVEVVEQKKLTANQQITELEEKISNTKYNKKTQHAIGLMKAKLAMMKERAVQRSSAGKSRGDDRFSVRKSGDGSVVLLGFPSVGKSTLLNKLTDAGSDVAAYAFTTLRAVPGMLKYKHAKIQIIDVPGIVSGAASGRGRGKEVLGVVRGADLILILIDALHPEHYQALLKEIYETGVRVNQDPPEVRITKKSRGGVNIGSTVPLRKIDKKTIVEICREMKISNADILLRTDVDADQFIDVIEGNKRYTKSLTVLSKVDLVDKERLVEIKKSIPIDICISAETGLGIAELKDGLYDKMGFIRVFLKEVNKQADMDEPLIMFKGSSIKDVCSKLHKDFITKFRYARLWGPSAKFDGQIFRKLDKVLGDKDVLELHMN